MPNALWLTLAMLVVGVVFRWLRALPDNAAEVINKLVLNLCLPALILSVVTRLDFDVSLIWLPVVAWIVMALSALVVRLVARAWSWPRDVEGALLLTAVIGNTAFLGYPITRAYLGEGSLGAAVLYDQLGSFLVLSSFGLWVAASYGAGKAPTLLATVQKVATFPAFIALVAALSFSHFQIRLPSLGSMLITEIAQLLVPLAMLAVGLNFSLVPPSGQASPLVFGLGVKMMLAPLLALGLGHLLLDRSAMQVAALEAAMPPMVTAAALAANSKLAPQLAAAMAGFGILFAMIWLPLLHQWL